MKSLLICCVFIANACFGQEIIEKHDTKSIAAMEMQAHLQQFSNFIGETTASNNFDVKYYRCEWEIDPAIRYIKGKVTVYYKMAEAGNSITLDLLNVLNVTSVTQHASTLTYTQTSNTLIVNFPASVNAGVTDSVSISYQGVPANTGFGSYIQDTHAGTPVAWSLSEAYGSRDWWPCKNNTNDKADSIDVYITHPAQYKAASNGILQSEIPIAGNKTITHWKHNYPISSYLVCMAVTNYVVLHTAVQLGNTVLPMVTYCYPEDQVLFQTNTDLVLRAMKLYNKTFGDYPFMREKYGHVEFGWGGGMEHQTSTFIVTPDEALMAHELGHQWFGDKVTCASWEDIWLNEGFATFCASYYMETVHPETAISARKSLNSSITNLPDGSVKVPDTTNLNRIFSGRLSYNKGGCILRMLRLVLGDDVFFKGLRRYLNDPALAYGNARTADLKRNLEAESGKDLAYYFDQWYTGQGYPTYNVQWSTLGTGSVNIRLNQVTSHVSVPFFKLSVPLTFKNSTNEKTIIVDNSFNNETFIRTLGFVPDTVLVDQEAWLITKGNTTQKISTANSGAGVAEIYPNPVSDPFTIYLHDFSDVSAQVIIFNKAGQEVYRKNATLVNGAEIMPVPSSTWARGAYIIKIITAGKTILKQVLR